jgi:hypothetical protein
LDGAILRIITEKKPLHKMGDWSMYTWLRNQKKEKARTLEPHSAALELLVFMPQHLWKTKFTSLPFIRSKKS